MDRCQSCCQVFSVHVCMSCLLWGTADGENSVYMLCPLWGTADDENSVYMNTCHASHCGVLQMMKIKSSSAENPELLKVLSLQPGVGLNTSVYASYLSVEKFRLS